MTCRVPATTRSRRPPASASSSSFGVVALFVAPQIRIGLNIAAAANALLLLAVPTFLIGICKGAMMHCRMVMLPTLIVLGVLTIVFAAIAIWLDSRAAKRN